MQIHLNNNSQGIFIRTIRKWTGLTQKEFAKFLGKSERQIQYYEAGTRNYDIRFIKQVMKKFDIDICAEIKE